MNPYDFFAESARRTPAHPAFIHDASNLTYEQALDSVEKLASTLHNAGVGPGFRVAVLSPNCTAAMIGALAVFRLGAVWVPVNTRNSIEQNTEYLRRCAVDMLLFHPAMHREAAQLEEVAGARLTATSLFASPPESARVMPPRTPTPDAPCAMLSTGGTTGSPKAVVWTERVAQTMIASFWVHLPGEEPAVYLAATPLTHAAGVIGFCMLARGATVVIHDGVKPVEFMAAIPRHRITHLFLPPTAIYSLLAHPDVGEYDYTSLRAFIYSAAPMAADKIREAIGIFGPVMVQLYGQAEVPLMCTVLTPAEHDEALAAGRLDILRSCGRSTLLTEVGIMDDAGRLVSAGQTGEVVVRGDLVMQGYFGHAAESQEVSRFGWHHTGDVGYKDAQGYVYIVDRLKDMIISGGFNVFSSEVEQVVLAHPAVQDCAVVGQPDEKWGEAVTAVLQLKPGMQVDVDELRSYCRERLGPVKAPKHVEVWPELPRSAVGKVLKREVRERYWAGRDRRV